MKKIMLLMVILFSMNAVSYSQNPLPYTRPEYDPTQFLGTWQATSANITYTLQLTTGPDLFGTIWIKGRMIYVANIDGQNIKSRDSNTVIDGKKYLIEGWFMKNNPNALYIWTYDMIRNYASEDYTFMKSGNTAIWTILPRERIRFNGEPGDSDLPNNLVWTKISDGIVEPETTDITISTDPPPADQDCTKNN